MNQHTHTAGAAGGAPTKHVVNVNDVIDNATFKPFHWQVLFWCLLIIIFDGYDLVIYGVALPLLMEQWSLTPVEAGMLASSALVGMMFGAMIFGTLADKFGRKKIIMVCTGFFSGFTFLGAFAPSPTEFAILRFLAGLGIGGVMPNLVALTSEYAPKKISRHDGLHHVQRLRSWRYHLGTAGLILGQGLRLGNHVLPSRCSIGGLPDHLALPA